MRPERISRPHSQVRSSGSGGATVFRQPVAGTPDPRGSGPAFFSVRATLRSPCCRYGCQIASTIELNARSYPGRHRYERSERSRFRSTCLPALPTSSTRLACHRHRDPQKHGRRASGTVSALRLLSPTWGTAVHGPPGSVPPQRYQTVYGHHQRMAQEINHCFLHIKKMLVRMMKEERKKDGVPIRWMR